MRFCMRVVTSDFSLAPLLRDEPRRRVDVLESWAVITIAEAMMPIIVSIYRSIFIIVSVYYYFHRTQRAFHAIGAFGFYT